MYQPKKYKNNDSLFIYNFIKQYPFATLILQGDRLLATHVPVMVEGTPENFRLYAHLANHNSMCQFLNSGNEMLTIFKGPDAYISSSWYQDPDIRTWDYSAVHINAKITLQTADELQNSLENLINHFEKGQENPIRPDEIPKNIWDENFKEITGFWLDLQECVGIQKLHQGFAENDIENIASHLENRYKCPVSTIGKQIRNKNEK